jgi:hypothetical protein
LDSGPRTRFFYFAIVIAIFFLGAIASISLHFAEHDPIKSFFMWGLPLILISLFNIIATWKRLWVIKISIPLTLLVLSLFSQILLLLLVISVYLLWLDKEVRDGLEKQNIFLNAASALLFLLSISLLSIPVLSFGEGEVEGYMTLNFVHLIVLELSFIAGALNLEGAKSNLTKMPGKVTAILAIYAIVTILTLLFSFIFWQPTTITAFSLGIPYWALVWASVFINLIILYLLLDRNKAGWYLGVLDSIISLLNIIDFPISIILGVVLLYLLFDKEVKGYFGLK